MTAIGIDRILRRLRIVLPSLLILLIICKILEVGVEPQTWKEIAAGEEPAPLLDRLGLGVFRRLDDVTFWLVVGIWLAARRIIAQLRQSPKAWAIYEFSPTVPFSTIAVMGLTGSALYGWSSLTGGSTFAWKPGDPARWSMIQVRTVECCQFVEGLIQITAIFAASVSLVIAIICGIAASKVAVDQRRRPGAIASLSALVQACTTPFLVAFLFYLAASLIVRELDVTKAGVGESAESYGRALSWIILYGIPYLLTGFVISRLAAKRRLITRICLLDKTVDWLRVEIAERP